MPDHINNFLPTGEDIEWAVQRLWGHGSGGSSRMYADNLWEWLQEHLAVEAEVESEDMSDPEERDIGAE